MSKEYDIGDSYTARKSVGDAMSNTTWLSITLDKPRVLGNFTITKEKHGVLVRCYDMTEHIPVVLTLPYQEGSHGRATIIDSHPTSRRPAES